MAKSGNNINRSEEEGRDTQQELLGKTNHSSPAAGHTLQCIVNHDHEISGAIFGCLLLEQVATFGEYFCRFLRPAVAGRRKERFHHHYIAEFRDP